MTNEIIEILFNTPFKQGLTIIVLITICWLLVAMHLLYNNKKPRSSLRWWIRQIRAAETILWAVITLIGISSVVYEDIVLGFLSVALIVISILILKYKDCKIDEYRRTYF